MFIVLINLNSISSTRRRCGDLNYFSHNCFSQLAKPSTGSSDTESNLSDDSVTSQLYTVHKSIQIERVIHKLLFLQSRRSSENTANLLAAAASRIVVAWSVHPKGGLLGYFEATKVRSDAVLCMDSDDGDTRLVTGDSTICLFACKTVELILQLPIR